MDEATTLEHALWLSFDAPLPSVHASGTYISDHNWRVMHLARNAVFGGGSSVSGSVRRVFGSSHDDTLAQAELALLDAMQGSKR